jgi:hypothetical protein
VKPMDFNKTKKFAKVTAIVIGIIALFFVMREMYIYIMDNRPFPIESLECMDAKLFRDRGNVDMFALNVTNWERVGVKDIKIRIGFFDTLGNPINATVITFSEMVPPKSTKRLTSNVSISHLPPKWKSTFTILEAKRATKGKK